ncbi:opsin-VA-like isoform X2 [Bolinopsis microptera]|uniref:opsin-VA-like isoform X2 n=1 Tax=Bolinopsis microptera TaxID=2820187 RepID=UPI003078CDDF
MITLENNETVSIWEFMNRSLDDISNRVKAEQIVLSLVFTCYTIVGIFGNALVLVSIIKIRRWSGLERAMMCFLTNLSLSDFLLCLITFPSTAISAAFNTWVMGINMCWIVGFAVSYLRIVSILFMMWIGVHRAFVIKYPFSKKITRRTARLISICVWTVATVPQLTCYLGISPMHYDADRAVCLASMISDNMLPVMVYALVFIVVPMGTIIGVYTLLLYIAINAVRRTRGLTALNNNEETPRRGMTMAHRRAFGTVFVQIGGFLLCFLPFVIFVGLSSINKDIVPAKLQVFGACCSSMSAIINPIIYMNTNKTFKKFVVNLLKCRDTPMNSSSTAVIVSQCHYSRLSTISATNRQAPQGVSCQKTGLTKSNSVGDKPTPVSNITVMQTFRNPSAVTDNKVIRNSTCAVEYNQNGPKFVSSSGFLRADRGFRRSQSDATTPKSSSPQTNPQRVTTGQIKIPNLQGPECVECDDSISVADSDVSYSERGSDNSTADMPASNTEKVQVSLRRSSSVGSIHSGSVRRKNGSRVSRSLDNFLKKCPTEEAKSYKLARSPKREFQRIVDFTSDPSNGNTVSSV